MKIDKEIFQYGVINLRRPQKDQFFAPQKPHHLQKWR